MKLLLFILLHLWHATSHVIHNPIIPGWNPDPAIPRVGRDYFLATSSMEYWPGIPIYHSTDLQNWQLYSHALTRPSQLQLNGVPTSAGAWAPSLSLINGTFYLTTVVRWIYDPIAKSDPVWGEPWGIDPELFHDDVTNRVYLNLMAPNNNIDRLWGIYQCEVDLESGNCVGEHRSLWNGTLPHTPDARPEGGTDSLHRATIARSTSPTGPWTPAPNNPLLYNGAFGPPNLTVQSTGHATMFTTQTGDWYAVFLARRNINGSSPLGRETFLCSVHWNSDAWPVFNDGQPIMLNGPRQPPEPWVDTFNGTSLHPSWYQLRTPYTENYSLHERRLVLHPNVFTLSDRDVPAAVLRKQTSLNMTFSATLLPLPVNGLNPSQTVGISAYLSELQHQDIGVTGCTGMRSGLCVYTRLMDNGTEEYTKYPLEVGVEEENITLTLHIRATPLTYHLGYSTSISTNLTLKPTFNAPSISQAEPKITWLSTFPSSALTASSTPEGWLVFTGAMFALFASGNGRPTVDGLEVGFGGVREEYGVEGVGGWDVW